MTGGRSGRLSVLTLRLSSLIMGDLTAHNIMCDPYTLEVKCVFDWENGGYLPEEYLHMWAVNLDGYYSFFKDEERLERLIRSIKP
jgi:hypothetical protein